MRKHLSIILLTLVLVLVTSFISQVQAFPEAAPKFSTAYELIDAVNALRADKGLYPYTVNSILMGIAQTQAEYLASISVSDSHIDAYGRLPYQRALDAGYVRFTTIYCPTV